MKIDQFGTEIKTYKDYIIDAYNRKDSDIAYRDFIEDKRIEITEEDRFKINNCDN